MDCQASATCLVLWDQFYFLVSGAYGSFLFFFFAGRREEVEFFLPLMNFNRGDKSVLLMIRSLSLDVSRGYSLATIFRLGLE